MKQKFQSWTVTRGWCHSPPVSFLLPSREVFAACRLVIVSSSRPFLVIAGGSVISQDCRKITCLPSTNPAVSAYFQTSGERLGKTFASTGLRLGLQDQGLCWLFVNIYYTLQFSGCRSRRVAMGRDKHKFTCGEKHTPSSPHCS